jgi:uncharacterized protein
MSESAAFDPVPGLARELELGAASVRAVVQLLHEGNTVPFIARYRKERTGGLDETRIRTIEERHALLVELEKRRQGILSTIREQGKLTPELEASILACTTRAGLEDLYLPYRPKRRTRATMARERGLVPLALRIMEQPAEGDPEAEARAFVDPEKDVPDVQAALAGARDIVAEAVAENADVRRMVRDRYARTGRIVSSRRRGVEGPTKFQDWYDFGEAATTIPSHRYLAVTRGESEDVLKVGVQVEAGPVVGRILEMSGHAQASPFASQLEEAVQDCTRRLLHPSAENELRSEVKARSDGAAVEVFARNLESLLLAAPFGTRPVAGVDPGLRTGCKCAAVDRTGTFLGNMTFNLVQGDSARERGRAELVAFIERHRPEAVACGNGTGGREAERFVRETLKAAGMNDVVAVSVSEAGASVYSASELAAREFPDLDLTVRGAISIARRLQDPLAELVKIDPKSIGVGQYQHDVSQALLARKLDEVVESCVSRVGVELNTASEALLARVAGIGPALARAIVEHRQERGAFARRRQLLDVPRLGPKAFEQAAGFLRIRGGDNPLDDSAVHPERYRLVRTMARDLGVGLEALVGHAEIASRIDIARYVDGDVGTPTLRDIVDELGRPGRDPREDFQAPEFREDVQAIEDLEQGMQLEGVVTNVTGFGAFVDVGVHRDGLVHVSELADRFVRDPAEIVKTGDRITVCVVDVDLERKRISLSARSAERQRERPAPARKPGTHNPFADALKKRG